MNDQLEVLKQGPLFLAHVLGLRWLRPGSLHGLRGLGRRFGPGFQGWPVRCRFRGGRGRSAAPWCSGRLVHDLYNRLPSRALVGAQPLGSSPRRSAWLPLSSQWRAARCRAGSVSLRWLPISGGVRPSKSSGAGCCGRPSGWAACCYGRVLGVCQVHCHSSCPPVWPSLDRLSQFLQP